MIVKFIDLFAGIGGFRIGFENAIRNEGLTPSCVFSSEIKKSAIDVYCNNFNINGVHGDISKIDAEEIPQFDFLLAGFPCQAFSTAGKRKGFEDTRGTLFFEIERILRHHKPKGFILENVEGLVKHDLASKNDAIGQTLTVILNVLRSMGYCVSWSLLNSKDFGVPQSRNRVFIVGSKIGPVPLTQFSPKKVLLKEILEEGVNCEPLKISKILFQKFEKHQLYGKAIKDRRGGKDNIHSWDLELRGKVSVEQKNILNQLLKARRNKKWAALKGIAWSDGMPLTIDEIKTFYSTKDLKRKLDDLVRKGYLVFRHPKDFVEIEENGKIKKIKKPRLDKEKGYDLVTGKLSFEISNILDPNGLTPTLVATDIHKLAVIDEEKLRTLTKTELKRLFGFPENFQLNTTQNDIYDLFGNSIVVPVVEAVGCRLIQQTFKGKTFQIPISSHIENAQQELF